MRSLIRILPAGSFPSKSSQSSLFGDDLVAKLALRERVAPIAEGALGELHDVALVDQRDALAAVLERVLDRPANEALGARDADRLDADARVLADLWPISRLRKSISLRASGVPCSNSIPE